MQKPNLFIIGAPKSGTTSMTYYLRQHPEIFVPSYNEPHYFNSDSKYRFTFSENQYLQNFKKATNEKYQVDGSVWYMYSDVAIDAIQDFNPDSKFIIMLRDPIEMFYSLHQQLLFSGIENEKNPYKAWELQGKRAKGKSIPFGCRDPFHLQYKEVCSLGKYVERLLLKIKNKENIFFISMSELKQDTDLVYTNLLKFLKVKKFHLDAYNVVNAKKEKRIYWLSTLFALVNRIKRKFKFSGGLGIANKIVKWNKKKPSNKFYSEFDKMKPMLRKVFTQDVELLERLTNKRVWQ